MSVPTILVDSLAELEAAYDILSHSDGGGDILLGSGLDGATIALSGGGPSTVNIRSETIEDPVSIAGLRLDGVENVNVSHLEIDNTDLFQTAQFGLRISESSNVSVSHITAVGNAQGYYDPENGSDQQGINFGSIHSSDDIHIHDIEMSNYFHGLAVSHSIDIDVTDNTFTQLQGDGIRMVSVQNTAVSDNHMYDFLGASPQYNHADMIQIWTYNSEIASQNIEISGNILDSGSGPGTQAIFIRNEQYDTGADESLILQGLTITDNVIHNTYAHGITVGSGANDVVVANNTLLWNIGDPLADEPAGHPPAINMGGGVTNLIIEDNIAAAIGVPPGAVATNNHLIDYDSPTSDSYVTNHFLNGLGGETVAATDITLFPDSTFVGAGAEQTQPPVSSEEGVVARALIEVNREDRLEITLDASHSLDEAGATSDDAYTYLWHLSDGTTLEGMVASHSFAEPGDYSAVLEILQDGTVVADTQAVFPIESNTLMSFSFEDGAQDQSDFEADLALRGAEIVETETGHGLRIGGDNIAQTLPEDDHFHDLESFNISFDLTVDDLSTGHVLRLGHAISGKVSNSGEIDFTVLTTEGEFSVQGHGISFHDAQTHSVELVYSSSKGLLRLLVDEEEVDDTEASGVVSPDGFRSFTLGSPWEQAVDGVIDNVWFTVPGDASTDPAPAPVEEEPDLVEEFDPVEVSDPVEELDPVDEIDPVEEIDPVDEPVRMQSGRPADDNDNLSDWLYDLLDGVDISVVQLFLLPVLDMFRSDEDSSPQDAEDPPLMEML